MSEQHIAKIKVLRYNPEKESTPHFETFEVPFDSTTSVLDALGHIKDVFAGDLSFRWSCRMAVCGSCGVMVNNTPKLGCKTFLRDYNDEITIEPLAHFDVERDLVVNIEPFIEKLEAIKPYVVGNDRKVEDGPNNQTPAQIEKYKQFSMCINCGLCYAACPQFGLNPEFLGPAAITMAHRYNLDSRDHGNKKRMPILSADKGVWGCTFVGYCSTVCPKSVDPAAAIQQSKALSAQNFAFSLFKEES